MATVTEGSIMGMAQEIVSDFLTNKTTLNDGVIKKATDMQLNPDQTKRLIERTNTEAFLRSYPESTEFDVASPEVVLGEKVASVNKIITLTKEAAENTIEDGMFKAASDENYKAKHEPLFGVPTGASKEYSEKLAAISEEEIFGLDTEEFAKEAKAAKLEYAIDQESRAMSKALADMTKTANEIVRENTERELKFSEAIEDIAEYIKQASLQGTQSICDSEHELLNAFPEKTDFIRTLYDAVTEKMASIYIPQEKLVRFTGTEEDLNKLASESELTKKFGRIIKIAEG